MILGLSLAAFTEIHVFISLLAIVAGLAFFGGVLAGHWLPATNIIFLLFTVLTSATGFLFPPKPTGPPFLFGVISLGLLAVALFALSAMRLAGPWRTVYLLAALVALYLNLVVLIVQGFQKISALNALAPTGSEPPVLAAQAALLLVAVATGWRLARRPVLPV